MDRLEPAGLGIYVGPEVVGVLFHRGDRVYFQGKKRTSGLSMNSERFSMATSSPICRLV